MSTQITAVRNLGCHSLALHLSEIAGEKYPNNPYFANRGAECLVRLDRPAEALARVEGFLRDTPASFISAQNRRYLVVTRSSAHEGLGDLVEAERSLQGEPLVGGVVEQLIHVQYLQNKFFEVIQLGDRFKPMKPQTRIEWAKSLEKLDRYPEARRVLEPVVEASSEAEELFRTLLLRGTEGDSGKRVAVVHGRHPAGRGMFDFLRAITLDPVEFQEAVHLAIGATGDEDLHPHPTKILEQLFRNVRAVVVVLTGDDDAKLRDEFVREDDSPGEKELSQQPRPNVLFEAGLAFGLHPRNTILVQIGYVKPFSDVAGRHVVRLTNPGARVDLVERLRRAGCDIGKLEARSQWLNDDFFKPT